MHKALLALFSVSSLLMAGCAVEAGDGDESISSVDQALKAVIFKGVGNTGFSGESDKTATIAADNSNHQNANGGIGIDIKIDDVAPFAAGSIKTADCLARTVTVRYSQPDLAQPIEVTTPPARSHNNRCIATVVLSWNKARAPCTAKKLAPALGSSYQTVQFTGMPITPAVGNITVTTKTNGVANADKYNFRIDPA